MLFVGAHTLDVARPAFKSRKLFVQSYDIRCLSQQNQEAG